MDSYKPYLCVAGAILINLTLGTFYSIGNLIPYIASYMKYNGNPDVTPEHGTNITSAFLLGQSFFIILGAMIERRFGNRVACIVGCIIHCTSTFLTMWAVNVNFFLVILVYGFGSGIGCGSSYVASIIAAQKWFPNRKGLLTGIIVGGFGFGGLIFTPLQTLYLNPGNESIDTSGSFPYNVFSRVPSLFLVMGLVFLVFQTIGCILAFRPPSLAITDSNTENQTSTSNNATIIAEETLPELKVLSDAFYYRIFYIIGAMMMFVAPGVTFVNSMGKIYGQMFIKDDKFLATTVAIAAVANALGRLFWGYLMDKFHFSTCYTIKVTLFTLLVGTFPIPFILSSKVTYFIWMLGLFFGFSGTFVLFPIFIEQVFGSKYHGTVYGVLYIALAISSIITSFLIQITISPYLGAEDNSSVRFGLCICVACLYIISLLLYTFGAPVRRLENAIARRTESNNLRLKNNLYNRQDLYPLERGTLAEKIQTAAANDNSKTSVTREGSLGSIVRYREGKPLKRISPFVR